MLMQSHRVAVTVTFLRMDQRPSTEPSPGLSLPEGVAVVRLDRCTVGFYRYLYETVGGDYVWWLRRTLSSAALDSILRDPGVSVHVLYAGGEPAGFFELDRRGSPVINLSYFGLMPHAVGRGYGTAFLDSAVRTAWAAAPGVRAVTVNTCTADHPRALPGYLKAGFRVMRRLDEIWEVPTRLGLPIPRHLLV
jgi:GNAT superfamily N-acetyltransferase